MKRLVIGLFLILFSINYVLAFSNSVDSEMKSITHYAEEYETGNINYVQLLVHVAEARQNLNEGLGAVEKQAGGVLKQEELKEVLGEPNEQTKWVWVEGEEQEKKLDYYVPIWKKIIFDGRKIQIRLEAYPSIFTKKYFDEEDKEKEESVKEGDLIYRLHFSIEFKKPDEQLNIQGKIDEIKNLAETFSSEPSETNAEILAKETVNAERIFESYFRQNQEKCEKIMSDVFGSENQQPSQNMIVQEISFYEGEKSEAIARLEMCDDCEWNWINLDLWVETRGPMPKMEESQETISPDEFKDKNSEYFKTEIGNLLEQYKIAFNEENWKETNRIKQRIWVINEAWNQKSNNVWEEVDKEFQLKVAAMSEEERKNFDQNYGWIKLEQEKRKKVKEIMKTNYEERKQFYTNLFSGYEKREYSFTQAVFKKRLIELFKEKGEEICDNNKDDNQNEKIDCADEQCGGKICGKGKTTISEGNESKEIEIDFYCIANECKAKEEIIEVKEEICGNHICGENETVENCAEDCSACLIYPPVNCSGRVIFSGNDANGCPLEPKCVEEEICTVNEDCKFLCGEGECIEGKCRVKELTECKESECATGDKKILNCQSGEEIVAEECIDGFWKKTGVECKVEEIIEKSCENYCLTQPRIMCVGHSDFSGTYPDCNCKWICEEEKIVGDACTTVSDCGGENDVCSNGNCVSIPEVIKTEELPLPESKEGEEIVVEEDRETKPEQPVGDIGEGQGEITTLSPEEPTPEPESESTPSSGGEMQSEQPTAGIIFAFFKTLISKIGITGKAITGFQTEGEALPDTSAGETEITPPSEEVSEGQREEMQDDEIHEVQQPPAEQPEEFGEKIDGPRQEPREDDERREQENEERCKKECARPCVDKCIRENCGEGMECDVDEESKKCESLCQVDDSCVEKCMKGGDWWKEFEQAENKVEKGGFEAGGNCRTAQGKTEGFIWFGGWGDPFEEIQPLKQKYYSGGGADWCKYELQNLIKQREEFEKGFNQEFARWFFEDYLANSAENWEQAVSGIFELYWSNIDNQREIAFRMKCLEKNNINEIMNYNLIQINYETEYGKIEYWEEIKEVKIPGMEGSATIISPYMKIWVFPPESFIVYEMKKSMKNHEFPGSPEDKMNRQNEEGLTAEEKEMLKQDKKFMKKIKEISRVYNDGKLDASVQFKNFSNNEVIFNVYAQIDENDIIKITPMLPEETPAEDVKVEIDFEKIYDLIYTQEKEMRGEMTESPPWDRKIEPMQKIKEVTNGVKMYFKMKDIISSAKVTPAEKEDDMKKLFKEFFSMMSKGEKTPDEEKTDVNEDDVERDIWESKESITGEIIMQN